MLVVPIVDQPRTENEIVDKIAVLAGGTAGLIVNPGGVSTSTQNLFATTNKMARFFAATKGVTNCINTMSKTLEKVLKPNTAQRITQYTAVRQ